MRARHRRGGRVRRDARPRADDRHGRRARGGAPGGGLLPRHDVHRDGHRGRARPPAGRGLRRRARAHQRAGQCDREARRGRRADPGRRHRRHHHGQHPAPRVAQRRGRADHRCPTARDGARRGGPHGRPDPARRHVAGRAAATDGARQHLPPRADRRVPHVVLPGRQPDRAARARPAVAGRPGRRRPRRLPARAPDRGSVAREGADRRCGHRRCGERDAAASWRPARPACRGLRAARRSRHRERRPGQPGRGPDRAGAAAGDVPRRHLPLGRRRGRLGRGGRLRDRCQRHDGGRRGLPSRPAPPALHRDDGGQDRLARRVDRRPSRHARRGRPGRPLAVVPLAPQRPSPGHSASLCRSCSRCC